MKKGKPSMVKISSMLFPLLVSKSMSNLSKYIYSNIENFLKKMKKKINLITKKTFMNIPISSTNK